MEQEIGKILENARVRRDLSKKEVAKRIGCAPTTIKNYEDGKSLQGFIYLLGMIREYNLDINDILHLDANLHIKDNELQLNSNSRNLMKKNITRFKEEPYQIDNIAILFYNLLLSNIEPKSIRCLFDYIIYPSKENPFIDDNLFVEYYSNQMEYDIFYNEDEEQLREIKATIEIKKILLKIRNSKNVKRWNEGYHMKHQKLVYGLDGGAFDGYEFDEGYVFDNEMTPEELKAYGDSLMKDHDEEEKVMEKKKETMLKERDKVKKAHRVREEKTNNSNQS